MSKVPKMTSFQYLCNSSKKRWRKNMFFAWRWTSKFSTSWQPFSNQHVKRVPKTAEICRTALLSYFFIILSQIELEKSCLVKSEILGLLVNRLTAEYEYSGNNGEFTAANSNAITYKTKNSLLQFYWIFGIYIKFRTFWKKKLGLIA